MKKAVITIAAISLFTIIFLFSFRYISGATEIEADGIIDGVLDGEAIEGEGVEQTNPSRESGGTEESLRRIILILLLILV